MRAFLRRGRAALTEALWERPRRIGGRDYRIGACLIPPPPDAAGHEPWMDAVYAAALGLGPGAVVDVGVNRMQILFKLLALDPARRYLGFEPQLGAAMAARDFARRNGLDRVEIVCAGLSEAAGAAVLKLRAPHGFDGTASIADLRPESFYRGRTTIPLLRGDDVLAELAPEGVRLINVDVEGAELEVLTGLRETLARARPVVAFEVLNDWRDPAGKPEAEAISRRRDARAGALGDLLRGAGLRLFAVRPEGLVPIERIARTVGDDLSLCNCAAAPKETADAFAARVAERAGRRAA